MNRRLLAGGLAAVCAVVLAACGIQFSSNPSASQDNVVGDVVVHVPLCTSNGDGGCGSPQSVIQRAQAILAFQVPAGVTAPDSFDTDIGTYTRDDALAAQYTKQLASPEGTQWVAYATAM